MVLRVLALMLTVVLWSGCGGGDPFRYVKVSGKVTYADGSLIPAARVVLTFVPQSGALDQKTHPRSGQAEVTVADGSFSVVSSHNYDDGLVPGKHKVLVRAFDDKNNPTPVVPIDYADLNRTPLEIDTAHLPLTLDVRKPASLK
jgi:hypothetical protein